MVWPTLGSRTAKEQEQIIERTTDIKSILLNAFYSVIYFIRGHLA